MSNQAEEAAVAVQRALLACMGPGAAEQLAAGPAAAGMAGDGWMRPA